jgi:tRNA-Thr(GGU) m(6)t(6)A37 methyltransferase TsaA
MATVSVRYIVDDVDTAIEFYCKHLGFQEVMHPAPTFAMVSSGDLRLVLSAPGGGPGGGQAMPDGSMPEPGGWNRFSVEVADIEDKAEELRQAGVRFRNDVVTGVGGKQVLINDPSGNPVELFEPTRSEAKLDPSAAQSADAMRLRPIGVVESSLVDIADAPNQGSQGAPDAWLVFNPEVEEAMRDLEVGEEIMVITWLDRAPRDVLSTYPGSDPTGPVLGVFSLRSPGRPNPIGLHRVPILDIQGIRVHVGNLEAVHGTPIVDVKTVLNHQER